METRGLAKLSRRRRWPNQRGSTTVKINDPTLRSGKEKRTRKIRLTVRIGQKWGATKTFETRDLNFRLLRFNFDQNSVLAKKYDNKLRFSRENVYTAIT